MQKLIMSLKKLTSIEYQLIQSHRCFDIYHPLKNTSPNKKAIIFAHAHVDTENHVKKTKLSTDYPEIAHLAPDGYELYAVIGQLSDYKTAEYFDICNPGDEYTDYNISPPQSDIFSATTENVTSLMSAHQDFDALVIKDSLKVSDLLKIHELLTSYSTILFHCSRCHEGKDSMKYFLPVEQHAHILAQNNPLEWSCF